MFGKQKKILILGGYGGNNVGDDAQLAGSLIDLRKAIPSASLVVLTPDLNQTAYRHDIVSVGLAPRVSFFDYDENGARYAQFKNAANRSWLIDRAEKIFKEACKYAENATNTLTKKQLKLIDEIKSSSLIYYSGGGYMMGPTASRLWDAMLVCRIANLFNTPVVMSGQNIGVWESEYDKQCAAKGFSSVSAITTRDDTFSRNDLKEVGVVGEHIYATHDDALFVPKASDKVCDYILKRIGLNSGEDFISLSLHMLIGAEELVQAIRSVTDIPIVIVPTCPPDQKVQAEIFKKMVKLGVSNIHVVRKLHSHQEIKGLISKASICVSSRHHPLIFAMGHGVPCLSVNFSSYFNAKNFGAMSLCDIGQYCLDYSGRDFSENNMTVFSSKLKDLMANRKFISDSIMNTHSKLHSAKKRFMSDVVKAYHSSVE